MRGGMPPLQIRWRYCYAASYYTWRLRHYYYTYCRYCHIDVIIITLRYIIAVTLLLLRHYYATLLRAGRRWLPDIIADSFAADAISYAAFTPRHTLRQRPQLADMPLR